MAGYRRTGKTSTSIYRRKSVAIPTATQVTPKRSSERTQPAVFGYRQKKTAIGVRRPTSLQQLGQVRSNLHASFRSLQLKKLQKPPVEGYARTGSTHRTSKLSHDASTQETTKIQLGDEYQQKVKQPARVFSDSPTYRQKITSALLYWRWPIALSIAASLLLIGGSKSLEIMIFDGLPSVSELTEKRLPVSTKILDRHGTLLYSIYDEENRTEVALSDISPFLVQATIAIEDKAFYEHKGFSPTGIFRALWSNSQGDSIQGGSTITQQLVKNRLLSRERTLQRKIRELVLSLLVEQSYTKSQILEMYLNTVAYGGSTYGVEAAAQRYFGKKASELSLAESALLAGLPQAPSTYTPFGAKPELAVARQQEVLRRMVEDGYITTEQSTAAQQEPLTFLQDQTKIKAPHFVVYVRQLLAEQLGEQSLNTHGYMVRTTLDLALQDEVQKIVSTEMETLKRLRINNGAALVANPQTGEILAMVGSKDFFDFKNDGQVNVTLRERQPGSSIKPLTYLLALEKGMTPGSFIEDAPISFASAGSPPYAPKNYDGKFHGRVTVKEALASSYNVPAVKMLAFVGINNMIDRAQAMGITTWNDRRRYGLSLTLGGGEIKMIDLASAYSVLANQGDKVTQNPILSIQDSDGTFLYKNECALDVTYCAKQSITDPRYAYQITNILMDNKARAPAFGPASTLFIPGQEVAVKTGTTNNLRDNWTIGYITDRVVAVWVGNNDNTPMSYVASGITGASPIWNKIMRTQLDTASPHVFAIPSGLIKSNGCTVKSTADFFLDSGDKKGCPSPPPSASASAKPKHRPATQ